MTELVHHQQQPTTDLAAQIEFAKLATSGQGQSILPDIYRNNPANVIIAVGLGASMGLSPAESLYRISVIKGKPSAGAELIAANVRKAGHRLRVQGDEQSCTATIIRADDPDYEFSVTRDLAWARSMGLAGNDNYKKQPGTMLQWRAITAVARLACPEALYGVSYTPDEIAETQPAVDAKPAAGKAAVLGALRPDHPAEGVVEAEVEPAMVTKAQLAALHASLGDIGITEREDGLTYVSEVIGRTIASTKDLTRDEASRVIDHAHTVEPLTEPSVKSSVSATIQARVAELDATNGEQP